MTTSKERVVIWFAGSNFKWIRLPDIDLLILQGPCSGAAAKHLSKTYSVSEPWSRPCSISLFTWWFTCCYDSGVLRNSEITSKSINLALQCFLCNIFPSYSAHPKYYRHRQVTVTNVTVIFGNYHLITRATLWPPWNNLEIIHQLHSYQNSVGYSEMSQEPEDVKPKLNLTVVFGELCQYICLRASTSWSLPQKLD